MPITLKPVKVLPPSRRITRHSEYLETLQQFSKSDSKLSEIVSDKIGDDGKPTKILSVIAGLRNQLHNEPQFANIAIVTRETKEGVLTAYLKKLTSEEMKLRDSRRRK
jgi:hypothetical protein